MKSQLLTNSLPNSHLANSHTELHSQHPPIMSEGKSKFSEAQLAHSRTKTAKMFPQDVQKKMQTWIRSRHLICSGNFFIFETVDYSTVDRFSECIEVLGGSIISIEPVDKIWMGDHRQVLLYRIKASLHTPCHNLNQYWLKYGSFRTRFDPNA